MGSQPYIALKWILFVSNLLILISGVGLVIAGTLAHTIYRSFFSFLDSGSISVPIGMIFIGVITLLVAFVGCFGSFKNHNCTLIAYATLLGIIFVAENGGGIAAFGKRRELEYQLEENMKQILHHYHHDIKRSDLFDMMQRDLSCCGVSSFEDWLEQAKLPKVPESCCDLQKFPNGSCPRNTMDLTLCYNHLSPINVIDCPINPGGCMVKIRETVRDNLELVAGIGILIGFVQLAAIMIACFLAKRVRRDQDYLLLQNYL